MDPETIAIIKQNFVSMAGSDVEYNQLTDAQKAKGEYQFLKQAMEGQECGVHQGIFVVTPSGKFISQVNTGWPTLDVPACRALLKSALVSYNKLPKSQRLGKALKLSERSRPKLKDGLARKDWLQLRSVVRSYDFDEMSEFDIRHPKHIKLDKLWYTADEARSMVPRNLTVGTVQHVPLGIITRMMFNNHLCQENGAWWDEHLKKAELKVKVVSRNGDSILLQYSGSFAMKADFKHNRSSLSGDLLGKAVWNSKSKKFTQFSLVSLSDHQLNELKSNMHRGHTKRVKSAGIIELDSLSEHDRGVAPGNWKWGYPESMRSVVLED